MSEKIEVRDPLIPAMILNKKANEFICKIKERIESNRRTAKHNHYMGMFSEEREANARADGYGIALDIFKDTFGVL